MCCNVEMSDSLIAWRVDSLDPRIGTFDEFRSWLLDALDQVNLEEAAELEPAEALCGLIVHHAGDVASRLGFAELAKKSRELAKFRLVYGDDVMDYVCRATDAHAFLAECMEMCNKSRSVNFARDNSAEPSHGEARCARLPTTTATAGELGYDPTTCCGQAYLQWMEAKYALGGDPTDREAYDWASANAANTGKSIKRRETWIRYVREIRSGLGQQKHWRPQANRRPAGS
jgi:hypothetical protein